MILAHLADLHLGFRQFHRQTPGGLNQREADVAHAFRAVIDQVIAERPDVVVVAGDIFHSVRPTNPAILFAFRQFQRLREALPTTPVVMLAGNHDSPRSVETGSILGLFETLGIDIVSDGMRRLTWPQVPDLSILAVPDSAVRSGERNFRREGEERYQVLLLHGAIPGLYPWEKHAPEYTGSLVTTEDLSRDKWSYVALGHYHVQREVGPGQWYSGAVDYVSPNPWGELADEANYKVPGKGWLKVDLAKKRVERKTIKLARRVLDLIPLDASGRTAAEIDAMIATALETIKGGCEDQVIRQVIRNVPRQVQRELNYTAIRGYQAKALHFQLDLRRPEIQRQTGVGSPGSRRTLADTVETYLRDRYLPENVERDPFVRLGMEAIRQVESDATEAGL
ncbi:MAG: DNA repair exonuclease [Gemmatimonadales bacterium]